MYEKSKDVKMEGKKEEKKKMGRRGREKEIAFYATFAICIVAAALVSATAVSLPFEISGYVFNADGSACNGPTISITNLNTGETFSTMTLASSNYYRVKPAPSLDAISEGDVLQFKVSAGTESGVIDHHITASDLNRGGLQFNITFSEGGITGESISTGDQTPLLPPLPGGPGPIATPTPVVTPTPEEGQTPTPTSTPTMAPSEEEKGEGKEIPGFEVVYALAMIALFAIFYLVLRRKGGMYN